ncbi:TetR family transcriptional regulator [Streptomyces sp. NPDC096012]|uniref:TetR/AcrR family transcriptional regulator n=1 Tax=Streptomyces sp. NPDC096012 TaxID=3155684 RepID=UPI00336A88E7
MEIARAAAGLFVHQGLRATRAEDIALAAGVAPRTFYRYFATKEEAVAPLYAAGAQRWAEAVRAAPADLTVPEALEHAVRHTLTPGSAVSAATWEWVRTLVRLADTSPALRKVWAEVCQAAEGTLGEILAARRSAGRDADNVAAPPAPATCAPPPAASAPAPSASAPTPSASAPAASVPTPSASAPAPTPSASAPAASASAPSVPSSVPAPSASVHVTPALRFGAAVAGAAVRVAVESWAATASPPTGPQGPAALALRNLRALRDFGWDAEDAEDTGSREDAEDQIPGERGRPRR